MITKLLILAASLCITVFTGTIYDCRIAALNGGEIDLSVYQGKKILLVPIASGSTDVGQLDSLQQLSEQYADKVVVIGFPTNSFGHEPKNDAQIATWLGTHGISFPVAAKSDVTGENANAVFKWMAGVTERHLDHLSPNHDFQKYLVSPTGHISGIFSYHASPLLPELVEAINADNQ